MPNENADNPGFEVVLEEAIEAKRAEVRTYLPGEVLSYDHEDQRAKVRPTVTLRRRDPETDEAKFYTPIIANVPVAFPSSSGHSITFPLSEGDTVELQFASRSLDEWLESGTDSAPIEPNDPRRHDVTDVVARPTLRSFADALGDERRDPDALVIYSDDEIHLGSDDPDQFVALADDVKSEISSLSSTVNALVTAYNGHTHDGNVVAPTAQGVPHSGVGDVDSDKVKAD